MAAGALGGEGVLAGGVRSERQERKQESRPIMAALSDACIWCSLSSAPDTG